MEDLPFRAEYAKSGRASCRGCKSTIAKDVLRMAVMVQSPMFDGKTPQWYHHMCFFSKQRPKTVDDIAHYESLRWEDQQTIKKKIDEIGSGIILPVKKGKKRDAAAALANKGLLKDFKLEYAKSGRAGCRGCEQKILKDEIRISKKDFTSEVGMKYGGQDMWHHLQCFAKLRSELGYFESGESLPGFKVLSKDDQRKVKTELPAIKQEEIPEKKVKTEDAADGCNSTSDSKEDKEIKQQNKIMFKYRDQLKNQLHKKELQMLLEANDQEVPSGEERILDRLSDAMTFGSLLPCSVCKTGQLVFQKAGYVCAGDLTEWTKCQTVTTDPAREPFKVPKELAQQFGFLGKYKCKVTKRVFKPTLSTKSAAAALKKEEKEEENGAPKVHREKPPLYEMEFVILGKPSKGKDVLKKEIGKLGGKVVTKIQKSVLAVISTKDEVERMGSRMTEVKDCDVHVVSEDLVQEAKTNAGKIPQLVLKKSICNWGSDPTLRLPKESDVKKSKSGSMYTKSMPTKSVMQLKGGSVVDPESGLDKVAHVYQSKGEKFTVVLGKTDIQSNKNSYYKLQVLEADKGNSYWVFRSWGRIGTTIGSTKLETMDSLHQAKRQFKALYEEKSGNMWEDRDQFVKIPGCMYPIDIDYGEDESKMQVVPDDTPSNLPKSVQNLVEMIFDVDSMKNIMMEFELDLEKMPLGKLSKSQIQAAYKVLSELQQLMEKKDTPNALFIDASNRFYTFIPHSFGIDEPPILNTPDIIKQKIDMLDALMEIEIAYSLHKSSSAKSGNHVENHYKQLNTEIAVLERTSEEFTLIEEYVKNTHASTHTSYKLEVDEVFVVKRRGEDKRYKPFKKLPNRKLLWHGSRTTNYAGILSQGLRIAPPEAPVTGYMFGKGIYFADMVSKSANYCCTTPNNSTGLLLLCEVALGEMYERNQAEYVEKLPKGKHSCKGVGMTTPDPSVTKKIHDGVEVPLGPGKKIDGKTSLLYNEYIVYDVAQVHCKYLLKMNFKYNY